jgi:ectoine hydroxylase-related dioxygenase (phytanoyl-CoA dioxygenase family)
MNLESQNLHTANMAQSLASNVQLLAEQFKKDGYLIVRGAFSPKELIEFQKEIKSNSEFETSWRTKYAGGEPSVREISNVYGRTQLMKLALKESVTLKIIETIIGQRLFLFRDAYIEKLPNPKSQFPLHQDSEFWKIYPEQLISMWIPFQDTNIANGVLNVVPGSHLSRLDHSVKFGKSLRLPKVVNQILRGGASNSGVNFEKQGWIKFAILKLANWINDAAIPFLSRRFTAFEKFTEFFVVQDDEAYWAKAVCPDLKLGDIIVYHSLTLHGSKGNSLKSIRAAYIPTFMGEQYTRDDVPVSNPEFGYIRITG